MDRGYVPRQLCLQALRYSMGELADTARRRLTSLPDPELMPEVDDGCDPSTCA